MLTYTQDQLDRYFRHIGYSPKDAEDDLGRLTMLQLRHMARVPFESLTLHYSKHHRLSLDLEDLFEKIVDKGRGGYCMEVNAFFGAVLRSLGYTLINVGGRVKKGEYNGWFVVPNIPRPIPKHRALTKSQESHGQHRDHQQHAISS